MKQEPDCCDSHSPHPDAVEKVKIEMCPKQTLSDMAQTFSLLGDPVRIGILHALSFQELCVCDLSEILGMSHSAVSHQLRLLRAAKMVRFEKKGRNAIYRLDDNHAKALIKTALEHAMHHDCR